MKIYMLRNRETGQYSTGSTEPKWVNTKGKIWKQLNHIKAHLAQFRKKGWTGLPLIERERYLQVAEIIEINVDSKFTDFKTIAVDPTTQS